MPPERVSFHWSAYNADTKTHEPVQLFGVVVHWLIVPEQDRQYGGEGFTTYTPSAIVRGDDGEYRVVQLYQLRYAGEEGTSA